MTGDEHLDTAESVQADADQPTVPDTDTAGYTVDLLCVAGHAPTPERLAEAITEALRPKPIAAIVERKPE